MPIERKDWEQSLKVFKDLTKNAESQIVNSEINIELYNVLLPFIESKLKEFPEEKEPEEKMPDELKDIVKEITNG
jgi:hypothetical protein